MNNKGFTLVELLGSMVVLGLLMALVVPNIVGILNNNKAAVYVEDAKKMVNIAKNKITMKKVEKPENGECIFLGLGYLDNSEFTNPPNGGCYDVNRSYVIVQKINNELVYIVQLTESHDTKFTGILEPKSIDELSNEDVDDTKTPLSYDYTKNQGTNYCTRYKEVKTINTTTMDIIKENSQSEKKEIKREYDNNESSGICAM